MSLNILIKTRPRTFALQEEIEVSSIFEHPMKSGMGKKENGDPIAPHYIDRAWVYYDDELINELEMTGGMSSNPLITFALVVDRKEAPLRIKWRDNLGNTNEKTIALEAK